jgi:hypothetical protein
VYPKTIRLFIFLRAQEDEPKGGVRVPLLPARRQCGRRASEPAPLSAGLKQADAFFPSTTPMRGAGQRDRHQNQAGRIAAFFN